MESKSVLQLVSFARDERNLPSFKLNEDVIQKVFLQDHVKDLPVVIFSIVGKFRERKSFFMNLIQGFLKKKEGQTWLDPDYLLQAGSKWETRSIRRTSCIWISAEPFVVDGPNGEKVAVVFMDTQATFNTASSMKDCSKIFALSNLLSNIQIYDLREKFTRDDLEVLQMFVKFGKAAQGQDDKPLKELKLLIWECDKKYSLGAEGGDSCLHQLRQQYGYTVQDILDCFQSVDCFLLPAPWVDVQSTAGKGFPVIDFNGEFKNHMTELLTSTLSWENLQRLVKSDVNGTRVTSKDVVAYVKNYVDIFNCGDFSVPRSASKNNLEIILTKVMDWSLFIFEDITIELEAEDSPSLPPESLTNMLYTAHKKAVEYFDQNVTGIKGRELTHEYRKKLEQDLTLRKVLLERENEHKKIREDRRQMYEESERLQQESRQRVAEDIRQVLMNSCLNMDNEVVGAEAILPQERMSQEEAKKAFEEEEKVQVSDEMMEKLEKKQDEEKKISRLLKARNVCVFGGVLSAGFLAYRVMFSNASQEAPVGGMALTRAAAWIGLGGCLASAGLSLVISKKKQTSPLVSEEEDFSGYGSDPNSECV